MMRHENQTVPPKLSKEQYNPLISQYPVKSWKSAERKAAYSKKILNYSIEKFYLQILQLLKSKVEEFQVTDLTACYERDQRKDKSDIYSMHTFIGPNVYWYLECNSRLEYHIEHNLDNCLFAQDVLSQISTSTCLAGRCHSREFTGGVETHFKLVLDGRDTVDSVC